MTTKYQITNWFTEAQINTLNYLIEEDNKNKEKYGLEVKESEDYVELNIINPIKKNKYLSAKNKSELYDYAKSKDIEIERLKKEIQELKKKKISGLGSISPDNTIIVKLKTSIQKLQEKIKDWEYDYEKLEENCKILNEDILSLTKENKENEKYIKELEKENEGKGEELCDFDDIEFNLKEEIEKLKKNEKLNELSEERYETTILELKKEIKELEEENGEYEYVENQSKIKISELKKENEKLNIRIQRREKTLKEYQKKSKSPEKKIKSPEKKINHSEIDCETGLQY